MFRVSTIQRLFTFSRPSAITWFVIAVIVWITIYGMKCGWLSFHVVDKVYESFLAKPSFTNRNSTSSIVMVGRKVRIETPGFHSMPRSIFRAPISIGSLSMRTMATFALNAATAFSSSANKMIGLSDGIISAVAFGFPCSSLFFWDARNDNKSPESFSCQVMRFHNG